MRDTDSYVGQPRLQMRGIVKQFPGCLANDRVDLSICPGEIHALLGENGAGKSTLVKIIYGLLRPDAGILVWEGQELAIESPNHARNLGIGMVFQHFSLFEAMTVKENIALGMSNPPPFPELERRILEVEARYGLPLDPDRAVHSLSVGEKQRIEIVRCLLQEPRLLIMDEPTSVLTPQEAERLFVTLRRLADEGCAILYISHKLEEVKALCQQATILRGGRNVGTCVPQQETAASMARMMIGEEVEQPARPKEPARGEARLVVTRLDLPAGSSHGVMLHDINFTLHAGEILGVAGVAGNGQAELLEVLSGERLVASDTLLLNGEAVGTKGPRQRRQRGLCFVPEERLGHGSVPEMSLKDNALLSGYSRKALLRKGFVKKGRVGQFAREVIEAFDVRCPGQEAPAGSLSGGNLQKFIVGREVMQAPDVLIVAQPTWGVDAGAAAIIHKALQALAAQGSAVLVISQDLDELFAVSHRLAAICGGRLTKPRDASEVSIETLGLEMTGVARRESAQGEVCS